LKAGQKKSAVADFSAAAKFSLRNDGIVVILRASFVKPFYYLVVFEALFLLTVDARTQVFPPLGQIQISHLLIKALSRRN
jgi:hypothetical protein